MKKFLAVLVLLAAAAFLTLAGCDEALAATVVSNDTELTAALADTASGDIEIIGNFPITNTHNVTRSVKISSPGGYTLSGTNGLFQVAGSVTVAFEGVTLAASITTPAVSVSNGNVTFSGGASFSGSSVTAVSVANTGNVTFSGTQFGGISASGGVVSVAGGTVNFNADSSNMVRFENNLLGVAVAITGGTVNFAGTQFTGNRAGAVSISGGTVAFNGNTFSNNSTSTGNGGAIGMTSGSATFTGTFVFSNNTASGDGGAIYLSGGSASFGGKYTFSLNNAAGNGGAIYNTTSNAMPMDATFTSNTATDSGGAIYMVQSMTIDGGAYSGNKATNGSGGTVYSEASITISDTTLSGSSAGADGGAVYAAVNATIDNSTLSTNTAGGTGGAVYAKGLATITDSLLDNNKGRLGGAVYCDRVVSSSSSFRKNSATGGAAGAIYITSTGSGAESTIDQSLFVGQIANGDAGAIYLGSSSTLRIMRSHFEENVANAGSGGAVYVTGLRVEISRSSFDGNSASANGGAVAFLSVRAGIINSTFANNTVSGFGGAVHLSSSVSSEQSAIYYSTFVDNIASDHGGGAVFTEAAGLNLGATAMVGNTASAANDLLRSDGGAINTLGYNIIGGYGVSRGGAIADNYEWRNDTGVSGTATVKATDTVNDTSYTNIRRSLFGSNTLVANAPLITVGSSLDANRTSVKTVALIESTASAVNPALDRINGDASKRLVDLYFIDNTLHIDARGVLRGTSEPQPAGGSMADVGAFELPTEDGGGPDPGTGTISYVVMSGIPNTMVRIGQTCTLTAVAYGQNGQPASNQGIIWQSSRPRVARIDDYGNLVSLSEGTTTITVTTVAYGTNNERKTDSATLTVSEAMQYNNVHPDVLGRFADFNETLNGKGTQVYFLDANPAKVDASSFAEAFMSGYGLTPRQVTSLSESNNVAFESNSTYGGSLSELKPSIGVSASNLSGYGSLLPLRYVYSLSWSEVSGILGKTMTSATASDIRSFFGKAALVFVGEDGAARTVLDGSNVSEALSGGALSFTSGGTLTIQVDALIGDAVSVSSSRSASDRADLIDGVLVVADNRSNSRIDGQMWLLGKSSSSNNGGSDGGGGCAGFAPPLLLVLFAPALLAAGRRKE